MLVLSFVTTILGLIAHRREWATTRLTSFTCGLAAIVTIFAFIFDFALFGVAKSRAHGGAPGTGIWLTLATWILLLIALCCFFFARRSTASRRAQNQHNINTALPLKQEAQPGRLFKMKKPTPQPVVLPPPAAVEEQPLAPDNYAGRGAANFQSSSYPPPTVPPPRREVGLPAFPENASSRDQQQSAPQRRQEMGLPAFPEVEFDQMTAESYAPPQRARIDGNEVVAERDGGSRVPGQTSPRADGYVPGRNDFAAIDQVDPRRQSSGHTIATPYALSNPAPEHIMPRRQGSDPQYAPTGFTQRTPPITTLQQPTAAASQVPYVSFPPAAQSPPEMPIAQHYGPANQFAQVTQPPGMRPEISTWPTQSSAYYTPYTPSAFHQQYPSTPAAVEYQYSPQGEHTPRGYSEHDAYSGHPFQPSRQSYFSPPAFASDPYNPDRPAMPAAYQGRDGLASSPRRKSGNLDAVAQSNQHLSSQLSELLHGNAVPARPFSDATTSRQALTSNPPAAYTPSPRLPPRPASQVFASTAIPPTLPAKPMSIYWDEALAGPQASGSSAPSLPPRPRIGSPGSVNTSVKADTTGRTDRPHQEDGLPVYEDPIAGPSGYSA